MVACPLCDKKFRDQIALQRHVQASHDKIKFLCPEEGCGKAFSCKSSLKAHKAEHSGAWKYFCSVCGKGFTSLSAHKYHEMSDQGIKPYPCEICEKSFSTPQNRNAHVEVHNQMEDGCKHVCDICGKSYKAARYLRSHQKTKHENTSDNDQ
jgi:KRAB domain-containing zinc finger protein